MGAILFSLRWRRYFLLAPLAVTAVVWLVPAAATRMLQGVSLEDTLEGDDRIDEAEVTSGRTIIWPYVIDTIGQAPLLGYGRQAMRRTGLADFLDEYLGEKFVHPHNAYLELLLDAGGVGFCLAMPIYLLAMKQGVALFRAKQSPVCVAAGGVGLSLVMALLIASMGSQTLYPREGVVGMWCAMGLLSGCPSNARGEASRRMIGGAPVEEVSGLQNRLCPPFRAPSDLTAIGPIDMTLRRPAKAVGGRRGSRCVDQDLARK